MGDTQARRVGWADVRKRVSGSEEEGEIGIMRWIPKME
jgi:hypothetical protein